MSQTSPPRKKTTQSTIVSTTMRMTNKRQWHSTCPPGSHQEPGVNDHSLKRKCRIASRAYEEIPVEFWHREGHCTYDGHRTGRRGA